ncbi:MAG TPA: glycosyltransferase [Bryobacteraceae bacterium]
MQLLRIGHFQSGYPVPNGITTVVSGLSRAMALAGHQVFVYGCGAEEALTDRTRPVGPNHQVLLYPSDSRNPFRIPGSLRARLRSNQDRLDVLVIHGMFNPPDVSAARCASAAKLPYIVCPHGPYHPTLLAKHSTRKAVFGALFEKPKLRHALAVQVFSDQQAEYCKAYGIRTPSIVVPNGYEEPPVLSGEPRKKGLLGGDPKLLYLGRIDRYHKGLDLFFEGLALALRASTIPASTVLTVVGPETEDSPWLRAQVHKLNLGRNVRFFGKAVDPVRWHLLESCDLFVHPSRYDGFPMAVMEAMTAGKPLLLSDQAGLNPWVAPARCAFIVRADADSIRAGLGRAIQVREQWESMGQRGLEYVRGHLSWDQVARTAVLAYLRLLGLPTAGVADDKQTAAISGQGPAQANGGRSLAHPA